MQPEIVEKIEIAGKFDGYLEAWNKTKFPVKAIKKLMPVTEEFEERKSVKTCYGRAGRIGNPKSISETMKTLNFTLLG